MSELEGRADGRQHQRVSSSAATAFLAAYMALHEVLVDVDEARGTLGQLFLHLLGADEESLEVSPLALHLPQQNGTSTCAEHGGEM